jgi:hypothetical protein
MQSTNLASSRTKPLFRRNEVSLAEFPGCCGDPREISRPAGENAGLRDDAAGVDGWCGDPREIPFGFAQGRLSARWRKRGPSG